MITNVNFREKSGLFIVSLIETKKELREKMLSTIFVILNRQTKILHMFSRPKYYQGTSLFLVLFSIFLFFSGNCVFAQTDPEPQAKQFFRDGKFDLAIPVFKDLVNLYPDDEELNFYLGASLAETEDFSELTYSALQKAPAKFPKAFYYLGQYFQAKSDWETAKRQYQQFIDNSKKKDVSNTRVDELLDMCNKQINPFKKAEEEIILPDTIQTPEPVSQIIEEAEKSDTIIEVPQSLKDTVISFQVNSQIRYIKIDQFKNESSKQAFVKGWQTEQELQLKLKEINTLRSQYDTALNASKEWLAAQIIELEQMTYKMDRQARESYMEANVQEAAYWDHASETEISRFRGKTAQMQDSIQAAVEARKLAAFEEPAPIIITDTTRVTVADELPPQGDKIIYKIQIGAYRNTPPDWVQRQFKKLSVIRRIDQYTDDKGITVFTVGELKKYEDAVQMQNQVKLEGIKDAVIAAYKNNERITISEARKLTE